MVGGKRRAGLLAETLVVVGVAALDVALDLGPLVLAGDGVGRVEKGAVEGVFDAAWFHAGVGVAPGLELDGYAHHVDWEVGMLALCFRGD